MEGPRFWPPIMPDSDVGADPDKLVPLDKYERHLRERRNLRRLPAFDYKLGDEEVKEMGGVKEEVKMRIGRGEDSEGSRCNLGDDHEENFQLSDIEVTPQILSVLERYFSRDVCHNQGQGLNLLLTTTKTTSHKNKQ